MSESEMVPEDVRYPDRENAIDLSRDELTSQIALVRDLRAGQAARNAELVARREAWELANIALINDVQKERERLNQEEAVLRELTLEAYSLTGSKKPAEGVGIRVQAVAEYDPEKARNWAVDCHHYKLLDLNRKNFEGAAKALGLDFVSFKEKPQATIAKDL